MDEHIIKTEFNSMFDTHLELYKCPNCGDEYIINSPKWLTEHFTRLSCNNCHSYIYVVSKNFNIDMLD